MFNSNTLLASENDYKAGYQEGADDVLIAFSEILNRTTGDSYTLIRSVYDELSRKFPYPAEPFEE